MAAMTIRDLDDEVRAKLRIRAAHNTLGATAGWRATPCYGDGMTMTHERISQRQLRNESGRILREVQAGAVYVITNNGEPVAEIRPIASDPLAGLNVRRARPGANFRDIVPHEGRSDETALESLLYLRGDR